MLKWVQRKYFQKFRMELQELVKKEMLTQIGKKGRGIKYYLPDK